jgi:hypothetical protein
MLQALKNDPREARQHTRMIQAMVALKLGILDCMRTGMMPTIQTWKIKLLVVNCVKYIYVHATIELEL